jgi:hypothetical protein
MADALRADLVNPSRESNMNAMDYLKRLLIEAAWQGFKIYTVVDSEEGTRIIEPLTKAHGIDERIEAALVAIESVEACEVHLWRRELLAGGGVRNNGGILGIVLQGDDTCPLTDFTPSLETVVNAVWPDIDPALDW